MALADLVKIPTIRAFLMDGSVLAVFEAILEKFAREKERALELLDLTDAVLDEKIGVQDIPELLAQAFGLDEEQSKRMACDVVGFRLLPMEDYVEGVLPALTKWGAKMERYPKSRVGKTKMSPETFASQLSEKLNLAFSEVLIKRCGFLIASYWSGEKSRESTLTFFSRATTIGGLGLSPEQAQGLMTAIDEQRDFVVLENGRDALGEDILPEGEQESSGDIVVKEIEKALEEEEAEAELLPASSVPAPVVAPTTAEVASRVLEVAPSHELAAEVPVVNSPQRQHHESEIREAERRAARLAQQDDSAQKISALVDEVCAKVSSILEKYHVPVSTLQDVATKRIRGVREMRQTEDILERDLKFAGEDLAQIVVAIEHAASEFHAPLPKADASTDVKTSAPTAPPQVLDRRFAALTKVAPKTHEEEVLPGARVSVARSVEEERSAQGARVAESALEKAEISRRPAPITPKLTVGSVAPSAQKRTLTDIQPVRRLVGPLDELATMTPVEFRRLSSIPADATQKIEDILATLQQHSYDERVKGIAAWRRSAVNQLYVAMTTRALAEGVAVAEIAAKRRAAGEESLSPAEIRAIGALNARLRF